MPSQPTADDTPELPRRLSPSRLKDYTQCPKKFHFKSVLRLPDPPGEPAAKGTLVHGCLEMLFENHPRGERTPEVAFGYIESEWDKLKGRPGYDELAPEGSAQRERLFADARDLLRNYFTIEDPNRFDPTSNEQRVTATVGGYPILGLIDRIDDGEVDGQSVRYVVDYKTGKTPKPRYEDDAFFAMYIYALLLKESGQPAPQWLRLVYVKADASEAVLTRHVDEFVLDRTARKVATIVKAIKRDHASGRWATKTGPLCNWCAFQDICPAFAAELPDLADDAA